MGEEAQEALAQHVATCAPCQAILLELAGPIEPWLAPRGDRSEEPGPAFVEELKLRVLAMLRYADPTREGNGPAPETDPGPLRLPGLDLLEEIGHGGMGRVYRAVQKGLGRTVAVKVIELGGPGARDRRERARRGAEILARLEHPNLVRIHHVGEVPGRVVFGVLEYVPGGDLRSALRDGPWPIDRAVTFLTALADAVGFLHDHGVVHGDLKPANVLLAGPADPRIVDLGMARLPGDVVPAEPTSHLRGTPAYMAPEQAQGREDRIGPATDVHALGLIFYEILTGRPPFSARSRALLLEQISLRLPDPPSSLRPDVPVALDDICMRCLSKAPADRYPDGHTLAQALLPFSKSQA